MTFTPCPYCEQPFGEIADHSPKLITFENKTYQIDVDRTWGGTDWQEPSAYTLRHWCSWSNGALVSIRAKSMVELEQKWEELK
jgi:hypothetical protein